MMDRAASRAFNATMVTSAIAIALSGVACGGEATSGPGWAVSRQFSLEGDFVALEKGDAPGDEAISITADAIPITSGVISGERTVRPGMPVASSDFYLAIKRSALAQRWFLTAFMKQFYPGNAAELGDADFGARVVSFALRGDRLMMFDASDRVKGSAVGDPELLIEAYPIVRSPEFEALPGARDYVLIDPSQGLNDFSVSGHVYTDPYLPPSLPGTPLRIGLSFTQNFRILPDGAAFEEVFAGDLGQDGTDVWGTLGVTLQRYREGEGFVPTPDPGPPHFFLSGERLLSDSGGQSVLDPVKWNFRPGMEPVKFFVSAGAQRAQADLPNADIIGALRKGIEGWNDVLGFRALEAVFVDTDEKPDNDVSSFMVDYPGEGTGFAFASWRTNPNTGEVRGASVYFSGVFFDFSSFEPVAAEEEEEQLAELSEPKPFESGRAPTFSWSGMRTSQHLCELPAPALRRGLIAETVAADDEPPPTADQLGERFVQSVAAHEVGHILGLRHNFKGSLVPPTSSLMEYSTDPDTVLAPDPGPYDAAAIRYLYQLSNELPTQPFCTDEDIALDPECAIFDSGADPLRDWFEPRYAAIVDLIFELNAPATALEFADLNRLLAFARVGEGSAVAPEKRSEAMLSALGRSAVPISGADAESATAVALVNDMAEYVIRRVVDPAELRGNITLDVSDPGVIELLADQAGRMLRNEDGIRTFALRRSTIDVLHALQTDAALFELSSSLDDLRSERASSDEPATELALLDDLIARAEAALTPYFN
jgi:hypothetical protein